MLWQGRALWEWQIDKLRELQSAKIFVSARTDPPWRPPDAELVLDASPSRGPLSGLIRAFERMKSSHLLALAIDMPLMPAEHLRRLIEAASEGVGVIAFIGDRAEPLAAVYPKQVLADFRAAENPSLQSLVRTLLDASKLRVVRISEQEALYYQNINEPRDVERLQSFVA